VPTTNLTETRPSLLSATEADVLSRARRGACDPETDGPALYDLRVRGFICVRGYVTTKGLIEIGVGLETKRVDGRLVVVKAVVS
jgi:hypothetical protein